MNYYSFKLSDPSQSDFVNEVFSFSNDIEINKLNWYQDEIRLYDLIYINLGGDKVPWEKGLIALGKVKSEPFDIGYLGNNFKIKIEIILRLPSPIQRSEFIKYRDLYDVAGIGPTTKGTPNQAIINIGEEKALILARAIIDFFPQLCQEVETVFGSELMNIIKGPVTLLEEKIEYYEGKYHKDLDKDIRNENDFKEFLYRNKYTKATVQNYSYSLRTGLLKAKWLSSYLTDRLVNYNLFSTVDSFFVNKIFIELKSDDQYLQLNKKDHGTLSAAIGQYLIFLGTLDIQRVQTGVNKIFYGAPGSGKSFYIQKKITELGVTDEFIFRTTFYPDYTYSDFVGQVYPDSIDGKPIYNFIPGQFLLALRKALEEPNESVYLIIEELNRGNAPAIFGDLFQLLDRIKDNKNGYMGQSEYPIKNTIITKYLESNGISAPIIVVPSNMFIYATMNSSDQNVFTLDTAFKRRWDFELIQNIFDDKHPFKEFYIPGSKITWEIFVDKLNDKINRTKNSLISSEDKQIGIYFVTKEHLQNSSDEFNYEISMKFSNKVLEFVWNDIAKYDRDLWFDKKYYSLDNLINDFIELGKKGKSLEIFGDLFENSSN